MTKAIIMATAAAITLGGCSSYGSGPVRSAGYGYDYNRPDPRYGGYDAARYYREDRRYRERRLARNDRVYRGQDGRYYCRRSDGTTGLIVGGVAGGVLGSIIAPGGVGDAGSVARRSRGCDCGSCDRPRPGALSIVTSLAAGSPLRACVGLGGVNTADWSLRSKAIGAAANQEGRP